MNNPTSLNKSPKVNPCDISPSAPAWKQPALPGIPSDGSPSDSPKSNLSPAPSSNTDSPTSPIMDPSPNTNPGPLNPEQSTFWSEELLASLSPSPASEKDLLTPVATSPSPFLDWLTNSNPSGLSGKTSPVSCRQTEDGILVPSSGRWGNSAMGGPCESWTLNTLESPSVAVESSLSLVLETGELPQRFFLSEKACAGILRRAGKRGKALPPMLEQALRQAAGGTEDK